jgi:hypothetical protein
MLAKTSKLYPCQINRSLTGLAIFGVLFFCTWQSNAFADNAASGVAAASALPKETTAAPNDNGDWKGDTILLANDVKDIGPERATENSIGHFFAPDGAIFVVTADDPKTHKLTVKFRNIKFSAPTGKIQLDESVGWFFYKRTSKERIFEERTAPESTTPVNSHNLYTMDKAAIEKMDYYRHGWAFGVLLVPYKYQFKDKSFGSALSVGPYVGYRQDTLGSSVTYIVSAGMVNNIPVALANGTGTVTRSGFSLAAGVVFSIDKGTGMQVGLLFGQDRLGSNAEAPYAYEGKTWGSVAIGYRFF